MTSWSDFFFGVLLGVVTTIQGRSLYLMWVKERFGKRCAWCDAEITDEFNINAQSGLIRRWFDTAECWRSWYRMQEAE